MKLSDYFSSPIFDDEEGRRTAASMLKTFLLVTIASAFVQILLLLSLSAGFLIADIILVCLIIIFTGYYQLLRRGSLLLTSILFILTAWSGMTILAFNSGGIRDVSIIGYILLIFLATLFNGYRFAVIIASLSFISFWGMAIIEHFGILVPEIDTPFHYARDLTIMIILAVSIIFLFNRSFRYLYYRIKMELQERTKAQESLSLNEKMLIDKNIELITSYEKIKLMNKDLLQAKEIAEKSNRLKTAFLQNISHEIRTPMNGIVGFSELLKDKDVTGEKREEYSRLMTSCTYELAAVINDLIDISKIEAGDIEMSNSEFRIDELLDSDFEAFSRKSAEKGLLFEVSNELGNLIIRSDKSKISHVLDNLVSNAVKFTNTGSVRIVFSEVDDRLRISVHDTGIGIDSELLAVIFDRFRQAQIGLNRSFGGTGLGLAISKGIADFMGGDIKVESREGEGSVFKFTVPVMFIEDPLTFKNKATDFQSESLNILIAEDDHISTLYLKEVFSNSGHRLMFAKNGIEAVNAIESSSDIDLVLMDLKMPEMNGYDAAKKIRSLKRSIPIIAITAFALEEDKKRILKGDFDDYVVKPVEKEILLSRIEKFIASRGQTGRIQL